MQRLEVSDAVRPL